MIDLSLSEIAKCTNGELVGDDLMISSVTTDSRLKENNDLFIALKGERFDAHDFIDSAMQNGSKALMVEHKVDAKASYIIVKDARIALGQLAAYVKAKLNPITVGITGTCGKTTVKDLTKSILSCVGQTLATNGNFNNDIGVPLTLLRLTEQDRYAIIEMGTNHPGEIAYTVNLVKPNVALINNVGFAHLEGFGSLLGVYKAKSEIYQALNSAGTAIFNHDSEFYQDFVKDQSSFKENSFSISNPEATTYATDLTTDEFGCAHFKLHNPTGSIDLALKIVGVHNVANACAAATIAYALGVSLEQIKQGLESYVAYEGRLKVTTKNNIKLIDDTYNASANAVFAAIDTLNTLDGYKILILGDMGELGDQAEELHRSVGTRVLDSKIDLFLAVGNLTSLSVEQSGAKGKFFSTKDELKAWLARNFDPKQKSVVLIKGSHSMHMHEILEYIEEHLC